MYTHRKIDLSRPRFLALKKAEDIFPSQTHGTSWPAIIAISSVSSTFNENVTNHSVYMFAAETIISIIETISSFWSVWFIEFHHPHVLIWANNKTFWNPYTTISPRDAGSNADPKNSTTRTSSYFPPALATIWRLILVDVLVNRIRDSLSSLIERYNRFRTPKCCNQDHCFSTKWLISHPVC